MPKAYRKKPVVISAIQWNGDNIDEMQRFLNVHFIVTGEQAFIQTLEGMMCADKGDYIICGVHGEFYPCKPDIFKKTYDEVEDD